jgi:pilus assembly protein CpaC
MSTRTQARPAWSAAVLGCCCLAAPMAMAQPVSQPQAAASAPRAHAARARPAQAFAARPCTSVTTDPTTVLTLGKSRVVPLDFPAARIVVGGEGSSRAGTPVPIEQVARGAAGAAAAAQSRGPSNGVADTDITLLSPTELFMLGRRPGSMNIVVQGTDGRCVVKDIVVAVDPGTLQAQLHAVMPEESGVTVRAADANLVLTGTVADASTLQQVLAIADSYADRKRIVNLLRVAAPQQVMLEVKIAEVSKNLLDRLGLNFERAFTNGAGVTNIISGIIGGGASLFSHVHGGPGLPNGVTSSTQLGIDANRKDGIVRVLAEPNIVAISGQSASFLSGGKIFIPVSQNSSGTAPTITLEEKEFGVGLKFTPTVLDGRVNLKIVSEVSELSQTGTPFTAVGGQVAILPSMTTRRVDTTVQLGDGQSFAVAGLIKNNMTEAVNKLPGLGEAPVLGALFRSTEFQTDQTELMFVVTPHLVKPLPGPVALPTDVHVPPNRSDVLLMGTGEGSRPAASPPNVAPVPAPAPMPAPAPTSVPPTAPRPTSQAEPAPVSTSQVQPAPMPALPAAGSTTESLADAGIR